MLVKSHWRIMIHLELKQPSFSLELKQPSFLAALAALWYCDRLAAVAGLLLT